MDVCAQRPLIPGLSRGQQQSPYPDDAALERCRLAPIRPRGSWPSHEITTTASYRTAVDTYTREDAAWRAGVSVEALDGLVDMAIITPDADGRLSEGDVRRIGVAYRLEAAGIELDLLADALRSGDLTLGFMDDAAYSVFSPLTSETFEQVSARTGIPMSLLVVVREATGSAAPAPGDRVREDEMAIVPLLEHRLAHGYRPFILERNVRVAGDSLRRVAETSGDAWNSEVTGAPPGEGRQRDTDPGGLGEVSSGMTDLDEQALRRDRTAASRTMCSWPTSSAGSKRCWRGPVGG